RIDSSRKFFSPMTTSGGVLNSICATDKGITPSDTFGFNCYICSHFKDPVFFLLTLLVKSYAIFYYILSIKHAIFSYIMRRNGFHCRRTLSVGTASASSLAKYTRCGGLRTRAVPATNRTF